MRRGFATLALHYRRGRHRPTVQHIFRKKTLRLFRAAGSRYWGIPGIDGLVRHITDDDPEIVEILCEMGRKVGPRYAYAFVLLARKEH